MSNWNVFVTFLLMSVASHYVNGQTDVLKDTGCGDTVGCFSNCPTPCNFIVTWTANGSNAIYTLTANVGSVVGSWLAVGFSNDTIMDFDDVLGCASDPNGTFVKYSAVTPHQGRPTMYTDTEVSLVSSSIKNGMQSCTLQRPISGEVNASNGRVDVSMSWNLLFARGNSSITATNSPNISFHFNNRYFSTQKVTITNKTVLTPPAESPAVPGTIPKPTGCGDTKGCFSNCKDSLCSYIVSWVRNGNIAVYTLVANVGQNSGSWIAVGFSSDSLMGNDDVLGCASDGSGTNNSFSAHTPVRSTPNMYNDTERMLTSVMFQDGVLSCTIERPIEGVANGRYDVNSSWTLLFATGPGSFSNRQLDIGYHSANRYVSSQQVTINQYIDVGAGVLSFPLVKAHGSLMIAAWIFLASIGIVLARYYKPAWTGLLCSEKIWFQIHRICMILVFCTTAAGFIIIFIEVDGYSNIQEERTFLVGHPIIGIIVMSLTLINPIMAIFRCHPGTSKRPIFNWAHFFVGTSAHILGVVNIFFGVLLTKSDVPYYLMYILGAYVAWQLFVEILLEAITCFGKTLDRGEAYELSSGDNQKQTTAVESSGAILAKRIILVVHCVIVAGFAGVLIGLLNAGNAKLDN
uniref:DOMON domain-containing protein n=1 Tax=Arion vulgaris TaxID=1028688 RepID=A0A0B7AUI7_9EUPU